MDFFRWKINIQGVLRGSDRWTHFSMTADFTVKEIRDHMGEHNLSRTPTQPRLFCGMRPLPLTASHLSR